MITKAKLKEQLKHFPDQFSIDELVERLIVIDKIERGRAQSDKDEVISEFELEKEMSKYFR